MSNTPPTTSRPIAVTGASGRLGGRVARRLSREGIAQRLLVRSFDRAPQLSKAVVVSAPYDHRENVRQALTGVDTVLMVSAADSPNRIDQHCTFIDAAVVAGVNHLVYTSFYNAAPDAVFTLARDHYATEQHIRAAGLGFTFLRDNIYSDFFTEMVGPDGVLRGPGGDGRVAAVTLDDIADVATTVLRDPAPHAGMTYDLTGPEALTLSEIAATITSVTGRQVKYRNETLKEAYASRASAGAPDWQVEAWVSTYTAIAANQFAGVSTAIPDITGHAATSLARLLARSRATTT